MNKGYLILFLLWLVTLLLEITLSSRPREVKLLPNVKILTFEAPLYFANSELFVNRSYRESGVDPIKIKRKRTITFNLEEKKKLKVKADGDTFEAKPDPEKAENGFANDTTIVEKTTSPEFDLQYLIFDLSGVTFIDTMGAKALEMAVNEFDSIDVQVFIVGLREEVIYILQYTEFVEKHRTQLYMNLTDALASVHLHQQIDTAL